MNQNYRYKKCTRRGLVQYKKLVPGQKYIFSASWHTTCLNLENSKGAVFVDRVNVGPGTRKMQFLPANHTLWIGKRDGRGWEETRYCCGGEDVAGTRRIWSCRSRSPLQNGTFWKASDTSWGRRNIFRSLWSVFQDHCVSSHLHSSRTRPLLVTSYSFDTTSLQRTVHPGKPCPHTVRDYRSVWHSRWHALGSDRLVTILVPCLWTTPSLDPSISLYTRPSGSLTTQSF